MADIGGVWRTIGGRRVFIKDGEDLATAMKRSGKFKNIIERNSSAGARFSRMIEKEGMKTFRDEIKENEGKRYRDALEKLKGKEDGTYDLDTGEKVNFGNKGYNVSFEQSTDNFTNGQYYDKISECRKKCDGNVYGGVFGGDPEISFYTTDLNVAIDIMKKNNQHSIWSNEKQDIIINEDYNEKKNRVNYR